MNTLAFIQNLGPVEWIVILALGLLLFGKRLPEVGKSLGKGIVEFKKGLKGVEDEVEERSSVPAPRQALTEQERAYRAPLDDGRRLSRDDDPHAPHATQSPTPIAQPLSEPRTEH